MKAKARFTTLFPNVPKEKFEDVKSTTSTLDACLVKGNSKYAALSWVSSGGGALAILDIHKPARLPHSFPMIRGHSGVIMDFDFYPFNENLIITASEDATLRLWNIPEPFDQDLTEPVAKLAGHSKKVNLVQFHPTTESIVASAGFEGAVRVWNIETQSSVHSIKGVPDSFTSLEWNHNGSQILTASRDKNVRIGDPRANAWVHEWKGHEGPKTQKAVWLGDSNYIATVGFSKSYTREMFLWDVTNLSAPVQSSIVDQQAGILYPFFDAESKVLYTAGKGDGNIRYFELVDGQLVLLNNHTSTVAQKGIGFLPKRCLNVQTNELMKCLKLTTNTLEFVTFNALRKTEGFQEDLFPPCFSGEPSLKADQWLAGSNAEPKKRSMDPELSGNYNAQKSTINISAGLIDTNISRDNSVQGSPDFKQADKIKRELADAQEKIRVLEEEMTNLKRENHDLVNELEKKNIDIASLHDEIHQLKHNSQTHPTAGTEVAASHGTEYNDQEGEY